MRYRAEPLRVQSATGSAGQMSDVNVGSRTMVARGIQSPGVPSAATGRRRNGPKVDGPKVLSGSKVARTVWVSWRTSEPLATLSVVWRLSAGSSVTAAISTVSVRGNGVLDFRKQTSCEPSARSFAVPSSIELVAGFDTLRERMVTAGRAGRTRVETGSVRPSRRWTSAVSYSLGRRVGGLASAGRVRVMDLPSDSLAPPSIDDVD